MISTVEDKKFGVHYRKSVTVHFAQKTFPTKDFSHKSFSTSFGPFALFLVVISHNNHK